MKDYINQQKKGYLNRLKHIQEKLFDYQMQLEELEDDLDNEGRETKDDVYFTLVLATKLLTKIIFPHIKEIIGEKDKK